MQELNKCFLCGAELDKGKIRSFSPFPMSKFWIPSDKNPIKKINHIQGIVGGSLTYRCSHCDIYIVVNGIS